jgi:hypothetical protein
MTYERSLTVRREREREREKESKDTSIMVTEVCLLITKRESVVETFVNRLLAVQVKLASISTPVRVIVLVRTPSVVVVSSGVGMGTAGLEVVHVVLTTPSGEVAEQLSVMLPPFSTPTSPVKSTIVESITAKREE